MHMKIYFNSFSTARVSNCIHLKKVNAVAQWVTLLVVSP